MRLAVILAMVSVVPAWSQHVGVINPSRGMAAPAGAYQYGNILFPGGIVNQSTPSRIGSAISGNPPYTGVGPGLGGRFGGGRGRTVVVPYAYPLLDYGYGTGYGGYGQQAPQSNVTVVVPQPTTPSVVINQSFGADMLPTRLSSGEGDGETTGGLKSWSTSPSKVQPDAPAPTRAVAEEKATIYLIALKDNSIRSAIGYWVEDGTLHYVTPQSTVNHITLDQVDKSLSEQLNRERKLDFDLSTAGILRR